MLAHLPTHIIAGPLGAGKTTLIQHLLAQRPADERWALLVNEFGAIGIDAALLHSEEQGVQIAEVAGGCVCCVNGVPMRVALTRLLRTTWPHRLFIEPSGLGHPSQLLAQFQQPPWKGVLAVQPLVMVLDAEALASGQVLPEVQQQALQQAQTVVLNKSAGLTPLQRSELAERFNQHELIFTEQGQIRLEQLPLCAPASAAQAALPQAVAGPMSVLWSDVNTPILQVQDSGENWSIGWRWHPSQRFDLGKLLSWLQGLAWLRVKAVMQGSDNSCSLNAVAGQSLQWRLSEWRQDSRLELIFTQPQPVDVLSAALNQCRIELPTKTYH